MVIYIELFHSSENCKIQMGFNVNNPELQLGEPINPIKQS